MSRTNDIDAISLSSGSVTEEDVIDLTSHDTEVPAPAPPPLLPAVMRAPVVLRLVRVVFANKHAPGRLVSRTKEQNVWKQVPLKKRDGVILGDIDLTIPEPTNEAGEGQDVLPWFVEELPCESAASSPAITTAAETATTSTGFPVDGELVSTAGSQAHSEGLPWDDPELFQLQAFVWPPEKPITRSETQPRSSSGNVLLERKRKDGASKRTHSEKRERVYTSDSGSESEHVRVSGVLADTDLENVEILWENEVDEEAPEITYFRTRIFSAAAQDRSGETQRVFCTCKGDCLANPRRCLCLQQGNSFKKGMPRYNGHAVQHCECHDNCACRKEGDARCHNRVVQEGLRFRLKLFKTACKGWGVRTLETIPNGSFIIEYTGEVISNVESAKRENQYKLDGTHYLFDINWKEGVGPENQYVVDATHYGNVSRFFNHSCDPNMVSCEVLSNDSTSVTKAKLAFFACKTIKAGTELVFDYNPADTDPTGRKTIECMCGARKCRGFILKG